MLRFFKSKKVYHPVLTRENTAEVTLLKYFEAKITDNISEIKNLAQQGDAGAIAHLIKYMWRKEKYIECLYLDVKACFHKDFEERDRNHMKRNIETSFEAYIQHPDERALLRRFQSMVRESDQKPVCGEEVDAVIGQLVASYTSSLDGLENKAKDADTLYETFEKARKSVYENHYQPLLGRPHLSMAPEAPDPESEYELKQLKEPDEKVETMTISEFLKMDESSPKSSSSRSISSP